VAKEAGQYERRLQCLPRTGFIAGHYYQFDGLVNLYNEKFAKPPAQ
jgi:hypothetical protein